MSEINQLTGRQIAAARVMLGIGQAELAARASISAPTLRRMEAAADRVAGYVNNVLAVRQALESAGVIFLDEGQTNNGGPGVRLRKTRPTDDGIKPEDLNATNDD